MDNNDENILDEKTEKVNFDIKFQMAILKMMFYDDHFCSQMTRFLGGDDKELNKYVIFETESLHIIFKVITGLFKEFSVRPSPPAVRQTIVESKWTGHRTSKEEVLALVDKVTDLDLLDDKYYRQHMTHFIKNIKIKKSLEVLKEENKKDAENVPSLMQTRLDDINKVSFEAESLMTLKMIPKLIEESAQSMGKSIPTGIKELDKDLHGGLPRDSLVVVLSGTNVGKSMFCISAGAQALKAVDPSNGSNLGLKVLMVPLEGQKQESIMRFASCLTGIEYGKLINNLLDDSERAILKKTLEEFDETRLQVLNMLDFNVTVESLMAVCAEKHKQFKFDLLIVDYGQLLSTVQQTEGHRFTMAVVFRGLAALARKFNCVVASPAQATRQGQENLTDSGPRANKDKLPVLRSADISEAFEIARVAGVILSLNMTDEERAEKKLRVFLEKQRHGVKDKIYGLITDYSRCNLITGQIYNSRTNMMDVSALENQMKVERINAEAGIASSSQEPKKEVFSLASWFGDGSSLDQLANRQKLSGLIDLIKSNRVKMKTKIEEMQQAKEEDPFTAQDEGSIFFTLKSEYEDLEADTSKAMLEFKQLFESSYPGSKKENIPVLEEMLKKQKETKPKDKETKTVEEMVSRFLFRYNDQELKQLYGE